MKNKDLDFVIITGDLVQGWYRPESMAKLHDTYFSQLGCNVIAINGNHDISGTLTTKINNKDWLDSYYNDKYFSFTCKDYYFICPDMYSHNIQPSGGWTDSFNDYIYRMEDGVLTSTGVTHLEWMTAEANKAHALGKEIIIALHWYRRTTEKTTSEVVDADGTTIPVGTTMESEVALFSNWCKAHNVKMVLIGHQHGLECANNSYGILHICAGWFAYRSDNYAMTTPWGIGILEFANGKDTYTQITPEHQYSSRYENDPIVIGTNGYVPYSRVEHVLNTNNIIPSADFDISSHRNLANCSIYQNTEEN
jgi:predicted phosphohydrolase